jgi:hypothetical protein
MAGPLADPSFAGYVRYAVGHAPAVMTDHAMTAVMGAWYVTNPDPSSKDLETQSVNDFLVGGNQLAPGLGIMSGVSLEPRLTVDYRWGRLYGLTRAHPN